MDFSRHLRHTSSYRTVGIYQFGSQCAILQTYFIMPSTHSSYLTASLYLCANVCVRAGVFLGTQTNNIAVINVTHVVIDFMCERNEFECFFFSLLKIQKAKEKMERITRNERFSIGNTRKIFGGTIGVPLKCDVSYCHFTRYPSTEARVCVFIEQHRQLRHTHTHTTKLKKH